MMSEEVHLHTIILRFDFFGLRQFDKRKNSIFMTLKTNLIKEKFAMFIKSTMYN